MKVFKLTLHDFISNTCLLDKDRHIKIDPKYYRPMNICFYISDYGYGHASRDIAVIRKMLSNYDNVKIFIKNYGAFDFIRQSLPQNNVEVLQQKNDTGVYIRENSVIVDAERTRKMVEAWMDTWEDFISKEKQFCESNKIDLILSDITPQVFIAADELSIPSVAISNFTWHYIFYNFFGAAPLTEQIKDAYQLADLALVLPFNEKMDIFKEKKEVSLVSREITETKYDMRQKFGIGNDELVIYLGIGRSLDTSFMSKMKTIEIPNVRLVIPSNINRPFNNVIKIPSYEMETQNYINMCDLVVSKTGYSTISEAIKGKIPMFLLKRQGFKEDEILGNMIERLGIGRLISEKAFLGGEWKYDLCNLDKYIAKYDDLNSIYIKDGTMEIIDIIREVAS